MSKARKVFGILFLLAGIFWFLFGLLIIVAGIPDWQKWGFSSADAQVLMFISLIFGIPGIGFMVGGLFLAGQLHKKKAFYDTCVSQPIPFEAYTGPSHTYRGSPHLLTVRFVKMLLPFGFAILLILFILGSLGKLPILPPDSPLELFLVLLLVPTFLLSAVWGFYRCNIEVRVNPNGLYLFRFKRQIAQFPIDAPFSFHSTKNYYNFIFYGTTRTISIPIRANQNKTLYLSCIKKDDFSNLVQDINILCQNGTFEKTTKAEAAFKQTKEDFWQLEQNSKFLLPKKLLLSNERVQIAVITVCTLAAGILLALLWYFFIYEESFGLSPIGYVVFIILIFPVIAVSIQACRYFSFAGKIPERILLTDSSIRIDENSFFAGQLKSISMTPAEYLSTKGGASFRRRIYLRDISGTVTEYQLGSTQGSSQNLIYEDYKALLGAVESWCEQRNIAFEEN